MWKSKSSRLSCSLVEKNRHHSPQLSLTDRFISQNPATFFHSFIVYRFLPPNIKTPAFMTKFISLFYAVVVADFTKVARTVG